MRGTVAERFAAKVDRNGPVHPVLGTRCWLWTGAKTSKGYGHLRVAGKNVAAHRLAWEFSEGAIPDGLFVLHHCDNPSCENRAHLFLGTNQANAADMVAKGRSHNQKKSACVNGHPFDAVNTYRWFDGKRQCLTCKADRSAALYIAKRDRDPAAARARNREASRRWRSRHPRKAAA